MKTQNMIEELEKLGYKIEKPKIKKYLKIPELGIEITYPQEYKGEYRDIQIPKGWRLIKMAEALEILDNPKYANKLFEQNEYFDLACEQLNMDRRNNWSRWVYRGRSDGLVAWDGDLLDSYDAGRVIFVREK